ncbi:hypothetical protein D9Q98_001056 [Chlorella vulgaris]|uniref:Protein N-terminal glutamine amidohydrolase n=1 Tax=Chlorella vulgaris TaxID=3077 RepID=A0A9D4TZ52_CHLVU|nr:hypothetical protein D9Q98_001056 [Chlorella vulgaris]
MATPLLAPVQQQAPAPCPPSTNEHHTHRDPAAVCSFSQAGGGREPATDVAGLQRTKADCTACYCGGGNPTPDVAGIQWPTRGDCAYTSCYCEENVLQLVVQLRALVSPAHLNVVFISNPSQAVPIWRQRASVDAGRDYQIWDYHVLLVLQSPSQPAQPALVFDLDTTLPFPCTLGEYQQQALLGGNDLLPRFQRFYRIVPAPLLLQHFASDRSHMRDTEGLWLQPPPPHPCITTADGRVNTLPSYLDFSTAAIAGQGRLGGHQRQQRHLAAGSEGVTTALVGSVQHPFGSIVDEPTFLAWFGLC